jgi:hypothetical protein
MHAKPVIQALVHYCISKCTGSHVLTNCTIVKLSTVQCTVPVVRYSLSELALLYSFIRYKNLAVLYHIILSDVE